MTTVSDIRWIELDGVVNMRDVGGTPTGDGRTVAGGRLIRSDNLQELTPSDVGWLVDGLGLSDVVDLRTHVEAAREGPSPLVGHPRVRITHLTLYREENADGGVPPGERELPWIDPARRGPASPVGAPASALGVAPADHPSQVAAAVDSVPAAEPPRADHDRVWSAHYLGYLANRPESVVAALRTIAWSPGAVIVHCAAGKDRTGLVVGMALSVAGAEREAVVADYVASAQRVPQILSRLRQRPAYRDDLARTTVAEQSPQPETMRMLLHTLDRHYGGVTGWLHRHGWTGEDTHRLRGKLLEGP